MAKKQLSFAQKAAKKKGKTDLKYIKYVNSIKSDKTGRWRFNERIVALEGGESLDSALKRIEEEKKLLNIQLPDPEQLSSKDESLLDKGSKEEESHLEDETKGEETQVSSEDETKGEETQVSSEDGK